ncbi:hypothetical protein [Methanobrevibacter sp.]|uniref:hypothetical protein n=1 Tax=Methanobrevibacter sp. TaxID=66852 RepID=UPI0025E010D9|nr:hypothetical protein [Methanobrevibacter sp.]
MNRGIARYLIITFISALIITYVICYFLQMHGLKEVLYIACLFGLYFSVIYAVNVLVEEKVVPNNYKRFLLVVAFILLFDVVFIVLVPFIFKFDLFSTNDVISLTFNGATYNLMLNGIFFIALFSVLMLILNYILYRSDKKIENRN